MANLYMLRDSKTEAFISSISNFGGKQIKYTRNTREIHYYKSIYDSVQGIRSLNETKNNTENISIISIDEEDLQNYYELS